MLTLNGSTQHIDFGSLIPIAGGTARTISIWFKTSTLNTRQTIYEWGNNAPGRRFHLRVDNTNTLRLEIQGAGENATTNVVDGILHNVTVTGSDNLDTYIIYLDGQVELVLTTNAAINSGSINGLELGHNPLPGSPEGDRYFNGTLTEAIFYNVILSADKVAQLHDAKLKEMGDQISPGDRVLDIRMSDDGFPDGGAATGADSIKDRSGNDNHGTPINSPISKAEDVLSYRGDVVYVSAAIAPTPTVLDLFNSQIKNLKESGLVKNLKEAGQIESLKQKGMIKWVQ